MSTLTVTYPVTRYKMKGDLTLHCPKCGKPMMLFDLMKIRRKQKDKHQGCSAECWNNCRDLETGNSIMFYAFDYEGLKNHVQRIEKDKILYNSHNFPGSFCDCEACTRVRQQSWT